MRLGVVVGDTLVLPPPMGWNSDDSFYQNVTEQDVVDATTEILATVPNEAAHMYTAQGAGVARRHQCPSLRFR